ncbi:VOC family protein [Clostridium aestuarii]|uniref:VOC family protein n=1 Tax=Clostridium aestuarii TaxID=338193 RepID=A0ABT4D3L9_9CLOT|nr:VOC family protein [Clostridium aestuarii]MCY6485841.1 VOC family protein [Clostridium aestuarii]
MKPMRMHHVGIVLPTMEAAHKFLETFGLETDYEGYVEAYKADLIFTKYTENESPIELIIPKDGSVLKDFNKGKGGIAHIAYEVEDIEAVRKDFESKGMKMLEGSAVPGTSDIIVNFLRPKYGQGILVEYVQTVGPIERKIG